MKIKRCEEITGNFKFRNRIFFALVNGIDLLCPQAE